jgi:spoIIIJ-associated protein
VSGRKYSAGEVGPRVEEFLRPVLRHARLHVSFEVGESENAHPDFENPDVMVKFNGSDVDALLANRAEVLLALEHLTQEMLRMPPEDHSRLCFDANDHRMLRIEELRLSALTAAEKVKATHTPFRFNPMTSRERRILHLALRGDSGVRSESAGLEPRRHVVIYPADMATLPEPPEPRYGRDGGPPPRRGRRR